MDFMKGLVKEGGINVSVSMTGGVDTAQASGALQSATGTTSQVIQKTTVIKEKVVEDASAFKTQIEKLTKENATLRTQVEKMTKIMATQSKELNGYKQSKATELQQMTTTIQTTSQVSSSEQTRMAELQAQIQKFAEENKRDDAQISSMKLTIDQQNIRIHSLETTIAENTDASQKKIAHVKEKLAAAMEKLKAFSGDDVADKQKAIDLEIQVKKLKDHLDVQTNNAVENAKTAEKWKADYLKETEVTSELRRQIDELTRARDSLNVEKEEQGKELEDAKKAARESDDKLEAQIMEINKLTKSLKDATRDFDAQKEKTKKAAKDLDAANKNARDADEKFRKSEVKCRDLDSQLQEKCRGFEVLKAKVQNLEPLCQKLQDRIVELENELKNVKDRLDFELQQDVKEQEQINDLTNKLTEKIKEIEKMQMGDAEGRSKVELLSTQITTYTTQITVWRTKSEEAQKALEEREATLAQKNLTIDRLRKLIAGLKNELEMMQELAMKFEINSIQTEVSKEKSAESVTISAEYKKLELEAAEHKQISLQSEQRAAQFRAENERLVAQLADQNAALEKLKNELSVLKTDLELEKTEKAALKAEKQQLSLNASKSVEKEVSFFKSAEEHVTTYRDEIGKAYNSITMTFSEIEHEIL